MAITRRCVNEPRTRRAVIAAPWATGCLCRTGRYAARPAAAAPKALELAT